jgi:hypothetical protein
MTWHQDTTFVQGLALCAGTLIGYAIGRAHAWFRRTRIEREYSAWYHGKNE